jgi:hypothetical protein
MSWIGSIPWLVDGTRALEGAAAHTPDYKPGGSKLQHDAMATVLIIGASRGIGLETATQFNSLDHLVGAPTGAPVGWLCFLSRSASAMNRMPKTIE